MSPNKNYLAGRRFEYERKKAWETTGYTVLRTAGSHGFADLVAVRSGGHVTFIQCKIVSTMAELERLIVDFRNNPPLQPSKFYHLCIELRLRGSRRVEQAFV